MSKKSPPVCQLIADSVRVICPHCGERIYNYDRYSQWNKADIEAAAGVRKCEFCEGEVRVAMASEVKFQ